MTDHVSDERLEAIGQYGAPITKREATSISRELIVARANKPTPMTAGSDARDDLREKLALMIARSRAAGRDPWDNADEIIASGWRPPSDAPRTDCYECGSILMGPYCPKCEGHVAAARREALEEAAQRCKSLADKHAEYAKTLDLDTSSGMSAANAAGDMEDTALACEKLIRALIDQPASPAPDYRALCARFVRLVGEAVCDPEMGVSMKADLRDALRLAGEMGVKP